MKEIKRVMKLQVKLVFPFGVSRVNIYVLCVNGIV